MASVIAYAHFPEPGYVGPDGVWLFDSGLPFVPEGHEAWMYDPKIRRPPHDGWPHMETLGMDVADLARRAGVSFGVASTVVQRHLRAMNTLAGGPDEPDDYYNPDIYPQNLPVGFGRRSYGAWNKYTGEVWSSPSARNGWRYHSEGYVDRARPSGMANKRPEDMYRYITPAEKRVYMVMYAGKPTFGPEPYWSGSVSVEPPYPDSPHVLLPNGKWGPQSTLDEILDRQVREQLALEEAERQRIAEQQRIAREQAEREYQQVLQAILDEELRQQQLAETLIEPEPVAEPEPIEIFYPEPEPVGVNMANIMFEPPEQPLVQPPGVWERGLGGPLFAIGAVIGIGIFLCKRRGKGDPYIIKRSGR